MIRVTGKQSWEPKGVAIDSQVGRVKVHLAFGVTKPDSVHVEAGADVYGFGFGMDLLFAFFKFYIDWSPWNVVK